MKATERAANRQQWRTKVEAGKLELERTAFSPEDLLKEIAALFAEEARGKGLAPDTAGSAPSSATGTTKSGCARCSATSSAMPSSSPTKVGSLSRPIRSVPTTAGGRLRDRANAAVN